MTDEGPFISGRRSMHEQVVRLLEQLEKHLRMAAELGFPQEALARADGVKQALDEILEMKI